MPSEIRPCTLPAHWNQIKPFDAMDVIEVAYSAYHYTDAGECKLGGYIHLRERVEIKSHAVETLEEALTLVLEAITSIAEALNAPVLVTEEVLAGLPKDAKIWLELSHAKYRVQLINGQWGVRLPAKGFTDKIYYLIKDYSCIVSDKDDPKTAEYLHNFYRNGVRIKEGA